MPLWLNMSCANTVSLLWIHVMNPFHCHALFCWLQKPETANKSSRKFIPVENSVIQCYLLFFVDCRNLKQQTNHPENSSPLRTQSSNAIFALLCPSFCVVGRGGFWVFVDARSLRPLTNFGILGKTEDVFEQYRHDVWWFWFFDCHLTLALSSP